MERKKKSLLPGILGIVVCVLLLLFAIISVVIAMSDVEEGELPFFLGTGICASNGAYEGVEKNAMVLAKKVDANTLAAGDVVVFYYTDAPTTQKLYLASILEVLEDGSLSVYLGAEYGDAVISMDLVRGEASYSIAHLGYVVNIMEGRYGMLLSMVLCVLLLALIVLLMGGVIGRRNENKVFAAIADARMAATQSEEEAEEADEQEQNEAETVVQSVVGEVAAQQAEMIETIQEVLRQEEIEPMVEDEFEVEEKKPAIVTEIAKEVAQTPAVQESRREEETLQKARPEERSVAQKPVHVPQNLKSSYLRGSFGTDRVSIEIACSERESQVMKKLIDLTAKKRNRFGLFTSISDAEECVLKVWCEWEDVPAISSIVTEVKKRSDQKG